VISGKKNEAFDYISQGRPMGRIKKQQKELYQIKIPKIVHHF
jgi:hypothetical protein